MPTDFTPIFNPAIHGRDRPPQSSGRLPELDALRGLAALAVVVFHLCYRGQLEGWTGGARLQFIEPLASLGYLGVHLFFIISGFVIYLTASNGSVASFLRSRFWRLFPAYWTAILCTTLVVWMFRGAPFRRPAAAVLMNLSMLQEFVGVPHVDGAYWSLTVELTFYLLVLCALLAGLIRHAEWLAFGWLGIAAVNFIFPRYALELVMIANWAPLFIIGIIAYRVRTAGATGPRLALWLSATALAAGYALREAQTLSLSRNLPFGTLVAPVVVVACSVFFLAFASHKLRFDAGIMGSWSGRLTYPLYLVHQNIGYTLLATLVPTTGSAGAYALTSLVVLGLAFAIHLGIERALVGRLRGRHNSASNTSILGTTHG
jgi:peptidoglycan/LPS O-acetylase OafA/YrhL